MSDVALLALVIWREARGESPDGQLAVGCSIRNRVNQPGWWGHDYHSVILKPWQYSSFNRNDPNSEKWPVDGSQSETSCLSAASAVIVGNTPDLTDGATHYYDSSIGFPKAWGKEEDWQNTLNIGHLHFWKLRAAAGIAPQQESLTP